MAIVLTFWEDPPNKRDPDDYDGIASVQLKSVKQIPELLAHMPEHCTMVSTEHSAARLLKNGRKTNFFKMIWQKGQPIPKPMSRKCPLCGKERE